MKLRKKLIEVALPLDAINRGCEEDKNRKTGHIRNLHKWFAPMPLPSWRAMLFAALVDDPGEYLAEGAAEEQRDRLFRLVERLSTFDAYKDDGLIMDVRAELSRSLDLLPTIVDPFCGGGSTLLEAQRIGLPTNASDLNPVPVLITTVLCRIPPLFRNQPAVNPEREHSLSVDVSGLRGLKSDVVFYAKQIRQRAWEILNSYYPDIEGATPFAYRWTWTVESPDPADQGFYTPLVSNWCLSRHKTSSAWIAPTQSGRELRFEVSNSGVPPAPTSSKAGGMCLNRKTPITKEYLREQGRLGRLKLQMFGIGARKNDKTSYFVPDAIQIAAARNANPALKAIDIEMPDNPRWFSPPLYGRSSFGDLFTARQTLALETFASLVAEIHTEVLRDAIDSGLDDDPNRLEDGGKGAIAYADAICAILGLCVGKMSQSNNVLVRWFIDPRNGTGKATPAFDRHAIPMVWDFVETNPFGGSVGDWTGPVLETALRAFDLCVQDGIPAVVSQRDARKVAADLKENCVIATDPPYYANIGYADLSDFFYLWIRSALKTAFPKLLSTISTPKDAELIATPSRHQGSMEHANQYFRAGFAEVFGTLVQKANPDFPLLIVYAIKQAEESDLSVGSTGWEVFLGGLVDAGISIVATWPVRTTTDTRMIGLGTNALASAIFVVGRRRPENAETKPFREFRSLLKSELPKALRHLQRVNIAPVDLAQAAIGPGMAVFTQFAKVLDAQGKALSIKDALSIINEMLDEVLTEQEGDFDSDSRWAIAWFEQQGFADGDFGLAEILSKAKNTDITGLEHAGILKSKAGKVRLLRPQELDSGWTPKPGMNTTVWEVVHHLVRRVEESGEAAAAELVAVLGSMAETARELAYRLYTISERKKLAQQALSYNALVQSWPEIVRLARDGAKSQPQQATMFS